MSGDAADDAAWQTVPSTRRPSSRVNGRARVLGDGRGRVTSASEGETGGGGGNAFGVLAPPRTPTRAGGVEDGARARDARRRAKRRARRLRRTSAALRVLGVGSTGQEDSGDGAESEAGGDSEEWMVVAGVARAAARAADASPASTAYEKEAGEITPELKTRAFPAIGSARRPPL